MLVIQNATHYATGKRVNVFCDKGVIVDMGSFRVPKGTDIVDATGLTLLPGLIDAHVHFREPGASHKEDWESGSKAAAKGGITTVLDMPNTEPPTVSKATFNEKNTLAKKSVVHYGFHFGLTRDSIDDLEQMPEVKTVKIFLGKSTGNLLVDDALLDDAFVRLPHVLFLVHAESETCLEKMKDVMVREPHHDNVAIHSKLRDRRCAVEAIERVLELVRIHHRPVYFCHVSTAEEVDIIRQAKAEGLPVFAEATQHHLFLDESHYDALGMLAKVNPPLRTAHDREVLMEALRDGIIDTVGTDHAPHTYAEKQRPYDQAPAGMPGLDTAAPQLFNEVAEGRLPLEKVVECMSVRPSEIFGLARKGRIERGYDADLVLVDREKLQRVCHKTLVTKCTWSPIHGWYLKGWPAVTIVGGTVVFDRGTFTGHNGTNVLNHA